MLIQEKNRECVFNGLKLHDHACFIYDNEEEWKNIVLPYMISGLEQGEKCIYALNQREAEYIREQIYVQGINVSANEKSGQLLIADRTYLNRLEHGYTIDDVVTFFMQFIEKSRAEGFKAVRFTGENFFSLFDFSAMVGEIEINKRLNNDFFPRYPVTALCQYNRLTTDPELLRYAIISHPTIIMEKNIYKNPVDIFETGSVNLKDARWEAEMWLNSLKQETGAKSKLQFLAAAFERCTKPMIAIYPDGAIMTFNRALCQLLGLERENVVIPENDVRGLPLCIEKIIKMAATEQLPCVMEELVFRQDGSLLFIEISLHQNPYGEYYYAFISDITEKKIAQERYNLIAENAYDGITIVSIDTLKHHYVNPSLLKLTGYSEEEFLHKSPFKLINSADHARVRAAIAAGIRTGKGAVELRLKKKDEEYVWLEVTGKIVESEGAKREIIFISRDITERKEAEQKLKESEARYRLIADNAREMISLVDLHTFKYSYVSPSYYRELGYTEEELLYTNCLNIVHSDDRPYVIHEMTKGIKNGYGRARLRLIKKEDGSSIWAEALGQVIKTTEDDRKILLLTREISERKHAEDKLKKSEEKYRLIADNANDIILILNSLTLEIAYSSPSIFKIMGYKPEDAIGKEIDEYVHPDDIQYIRRTLQERMGAGEGRVELRTKKKDGSYIWVEAVGKLVKNGFPPGVLLVIRDIHKRRMVQDEVQASEKRLRLITDNMSDCVAFVNHEGIIEYISPSIKSITGYEAWELQGTVEPEIYFPEDLERLKQYWIKLKETTNTEKIEYRVRHKEGYYIWLEAVGKVLYENGQYQGIVFNARDVTRRKLTEERLKRSEEKYRLIADNSLDMISIICSHTYAYLYVSPSKSKVLGYSQEDYLTSNVLDFIYPDDKEYVNRVLREGIARGGGSGEFRIRKKDGNYLWMESVGKVISGREETLLVSRNIHQRKLAEEALRKSEGRLRQIAENMLDGIIVLRRDNAAEYISPSFFNILGYEVEFLQQLNLMKLVHPDDKKRIKNFIEQMFIGKASRIEYRVRHIKGHYVWLESVGNNLIGTDGTVNQVVFATRDIVQRKKMEQDIKEQLDYKNILIDNMNELFYTHDIEGRLLFGNQKAREATGYTGEAIGKYLYEFVAEKDRELVRKTINERMKSGKTGSYEQKIRCKDDRELLVKVKAAPIIVDGEITGGMVLAEDITEQRKIEKEMARLAQLHTVGEMAASIGHEIRNPMTTVKGFLQMMMRSRDFEGYREELDIMLEELERANSIITEFLSLARNKMINLKPSNLNDIIKAIFPLLQADAILGDKVIELDLQSIPELLLDEKEIRQLILNLVRNGVEALSPGGMVSIKTGLEENQVVLQVRDEGGGIAQEILDKLGTPFFTTKEDGTGLGLAICYGIVERHGATIHVESSDAGTAFSVRFKILS